MASPLKTWRTVWVEGEKSLDGALNAIEAGGEVIFSVIFIRYSSEGKTGYRIVVYKENKSNAK